jgi:hypothetical protein
MILIIKTATNVNKMWKAATDKGFREKNISKCIGN